MSDIELLPTEGADQPGFSTEPGNTGPSHDLAVSDGVSGLGSDVRLSDEAGDSEFGANEADAVEGAVATRAIEVDDNDLLGDTEMTEAIATRAADPDGKLANTLAHINEALGDAATGAHTADERVAQQAKLNELARSAQGYQDSAFGPRTALTEKDRDDQASSDDPEDAARVAREMAYARARDEDLEIINREAWRSSNPTFSDHALQESFSRDGASQVALREAYDTARARYDAALVAHDNYWSHDTVEARQAVSREIHLARDQLGAAGDLLFRNQEVVNDTIFNDGIRYVNGIPVSGRAEDRIAAAQVQVAQAHGDVAERTDGDGQNASATGNEATAEEAPGSGKSVAAEQLIGQLAAAAGDQRLVIDTGLIAESTYYAADRSTATLERPHVGDRFGETDQLRGRTAGERARLKQLERLPHTGFTSQEITQVRAQIAALGYPVDNFRQFNHKQNERGTEDTIASWLGHGHGEFTVYDLYHKMIPEKRLGTLGHETAHANSPLKPENEAVFGGQEGQFEAAQYIERVAQQSLETGVHLNGYHKYLMDEHKTNVGNLWNAFEDGEIDGEQFNAAHAEASRKFKEETWAIMNEMALTNRNGLAEVEARQFKALEDLTRQHGEEKVPARIALISDAPTERDPDPQTHGIDRWLIHLIDGVNNQQELVQHVATLKQRFYGAANNEKAAQRVQQRYAQAA